MEAEITKAEEEKRNLAVKERDEEFKKQLEEVLKNQVQNNTTGMPGLVPPLLPKQIDTLNNKKPVDDEQSEQQVLPPVKDSPVQGPETSGLSNTGGLVVTLTVSSTHVDTGNTINVEWEVMSGISSAYDWIGLFGVDQPNKQYLTYEWRGKDLRYQK